MLSCSERHHGFAPSARTTGNRAVPAGSDARNSQNLAVALNGAARPAAVGCLLMSSMQVEEKKLKQMAAGAAPTSTPMSLTAPPAGAIQRFGRTVQQQPCSSTNHTAVVAPLASALAAARQRTEVPVVVGENTAGASAPAEVQPMSEDESEGSEEESESDDDDDEMDGEDGTSLRMQRILQARLGDNYNAGGAFRQHARS